jgi:hypothetical protein
MLFTGLSLPARRPATNGAVEMVIADRAAFYGKTTDIMITIQP